MTSASRFIHSLLSSEADAIIATDRAALIRIWNPGAERIFSYTRAEAIGKSLDIIIPANLRQRHWQGYFKTMDTGTSRYGAGDLLAVPATTKDGRRISVEFTITMQFDKAGGVTGTVAILRDVTARFEETRALKRQIASAR